MDATDVAVRRQVSAMGAVAFEVGLLKTDGAGGSVMIPRVWDQETLLRSIPWLRFQNMQGCNIYVRPKGEHDLSLVDDLKREAIEKMKREGFQPAVVVETSRGNFQAWLKHPVVLPREVSTAAARELAARFGGDPGAADWRHFGRLGGFTNRKPMHAMEDGRFPFARVVEDLGQRYAAGQAFVGEIERKVQGQQSKREQVHRSAHPNPGPLKTIDSFRANPVYAGDHTRSDLAYAIYALAHGSSERQVGEAIRTRDLRHKGNEKRQDQYVERTVNKALSMVTHGRER